MSDEKAKKTNITIDPALHKALRDRARREGRFLHALVEEKLRELVTPQQLELVKPE